MLIALAFKKQRFYLFTRRDPDESDEVGFLHVLHAAAAMAFAQHCSQCLFRVAPPFFPLCQAGRDVFNEKPMGEDVFIPETTTKPGLGKAVSRSCTTCPLSLLPFDMTPWHFVLSYHGSYTLGNHPYYHG